MNLECLADENFCQTVGMVLLRWRVDDFNSLIDDHFTDVVVLDTDMFDISQALNLLSSGDGTEVVL